MAAYRFSLSSSVTATRTSSGRILALLAVSGVGILALVFLAALWAGTESDAAALDRQRQLVNSRLQDQVQRVLQDVRLIGAGYRSLLMATTPAMVAPSQAEPHFAHVAAAETFGTIATTVFGYDAVFLVAADGTLAMESDPQAIRRFRWVRPLLQPMMTEVQADQRRFGADQSALSRVELMRLEGRPAVVGITPITAGSPLDTRSLMSRDRLLLITFRFLDGAALDTLSREQGLNGARYARAADQEETEVAFQIEATKSHEPIGFIIWKPDLPGSRVIGRLVPVLSVAALAIAALFFYLMARLRRSLGELGASERHARHLSLHDVLTGLPNRALFATRFDECLKAMAITQRSAAIALIDLDRFKEVNDEHGHPVGDELLCAAVARIVALVGANATLARFGGDEFALLLPDLREQEADHASLCQSLVRALAQPFRLSNGDVTVTIGCSIGIAILDHAQISSEEILRRADLALYEAKSHGRGRFVTYQPEMDHKVDAREKLKAELRALLVSDQAGRMAGDDDSLPPFGRLEIFFQSVHRGDAKGTLTGAEALLRWQHPIKGLLTPDLFIPLAEEGGLMTALGKWVLREAARHAVGWPHSMSLAVNVSPSQIRHAAFDQDVLDILSETGLPASRLELEITEAALFRIGAEAEAAFARLRSKGVRIALDDFGTGFSSLSHLLHVPVDRIKIDRSFVGLIGSKAEGAAIVSALVNLSRTLGAAATAEGVETESQRDFLIAIGCQDLQGYLFSRPVPATRFTPELDAAEGWIGHRM
ncbi:diguanylate phosphodiesterase [Xaviernesmea oryzae]|uniref:Diguanylate phosphodiesterase n=1 Tax=Xaviernesmea oryzae TaxID=464029 RepID=A0A1Q9AY09_9HYPH|nr:EAL domain-containing protein [Xaviernesmea oryzae]OLP60315.1 diguanylate phosphodiesterase [Xaviernesmea oryzae]SEK23637.1 diguanylate cyclase (GGDEF) domain-containing protein [Xaviernesmea oryzae]